MKTTVKSFFLLILASATLAACDDCGNISITEPTPEDSQWLVYGTGDTALFKDQAGNTITYLRTGIYAQNVPGDGFSVTDDCVSQRNTQVTNIIEDKDRKLPYMGTYILKKPDSLIVKIGVGDKAAWNITSSTPTEDYKLNDTLYTAYILERADTATEGPAKVYFTKEKGFVKVEFDNENSLELINVY
ncbi:hypothetical protein [Pontibacter mangrovi]|uniref:Lipocalin-like domain-containing protein n=1 Tax=Pontibacter mangrovi TaxID=2589816 RepID=A0A501W7B7_9BACT|nr:hypothetical protein [Pontibacter mangrovi]TPE44485.1 hypothetical protein FJM65_10110 [Pontibacter mangrovi]